MQKEWTPENIKEFLDTLMKEKDKNTQYQYIVVNIPAHKIFEEVLLQNTDIKCKIDEIAGMKYTVTNQFKNQTDPVAIVCPIDLARVLSVYTDYEGNAVMMEDLFNSNITTWTNIKTQEA